MLAQGRNYKSPSAPVCLRFNQAEVIYWIKGSKLKIVDSWMTLKRIITSESENLRGKKSKLATFRRPRELEHLCSLNISNVISFSERTVGWVKHMGYSLLKLMTHSCPRWRKSCHTYKCDGWAKDRFGGSGCSPTPVRSLALTPLAVVYAANPS